MLFFFAVGTNGLHREPSLYYICLYMPNFISFEVFVAMDQPSNTLCHMKTR